MTEPKITKRSQVNSWVLGKDGLRTKISRVKPYASLTDLCRVARAVIGLTVGDADSKRMSIVSDQAVISSEIARRYAAALYDLSEDAKSLKILEKDVKVFRGLLAENSDMQRLIFNPVFAIDDKIAALSAIAKKAKLSPLFIQFIGLVAQNSRSGDLPAILAAYQDLAARKDGRQIAKVISAVKLQAAQLSRLQTQLKTSLGRAVDIEAHVDPDLLGGFIVQIGSRLYDSSLKTQLEDIKLTLKDA